LLNLFYLNNDPLSRLNNPEIIVFVRFLDLTSGEFRKRDHDFISPRDLCGEIDF
jgi:hypothetical protein